MTANRSFIFLKRLLVFAGSETAYDQEFHIGLNILRGENSSGKSTILDFIFYILGGDLVISKTAAAQCSLVVAEVEVNGTTLTLQREISAEIRRPMAIFYGPYEESKKSRFHNWTQYPYASQGGTESFSKFLFRSLGFPEVKADVDSSITMNQVLRLAYVDQVSRRTSLMREEDWDGWLKRRTIAQLLFGNYDDSLYGDELNLNTRKKELEDIQLQITNAVDVFKEVGEEIDSEKIKTRSDKTRKRLDEVNSAIESILSDKSRIVDTSQTEIAYISKDLIANKTALAKAAEDIAALDYEIVDANVFIETITNRFKAIGDSLATRDALGEFLAHLCEARDRLKPQRQNVVGQRSLDDAGTGARLSRGLGNGGHTSARVMGIRTHNSPPKRNGRRGAPRCSFELR